MLLINDNIIRLTRGDSAYIDVELEMPTGGTYSPDENDEILFTLRKSNYPKKNAADTDYALQKRLENNQLKLRPEDTKDLPYGNYIFDMEIRYNSGDVETFLSGMLVLLPEVS